MEKTKKIISVILVAATVFTLAACGKQTTSVDVPTLTWYVHGDTQSDVASVMNEVNKITVSKIGAKLDLKFVDQPSYNDKMKMMMASGGNFDICFTGYVNPYRDGAQRGGLLELDEYLKKSPELYKMIPDYTWDTVKCNGKIYAVPNLQINAIQLNLFTFKDLADKYGLTSQLDNLDKIGLKQMEDYMQKIKDNEPSYYPVRFNKGSVHFTTYDNSELTSYTESTAGVSVYYDKNGKLLELSSSLYNGKSIYAAKKACEWYERGFIRSDIVSMTNDTVEQNAGKYATWVEKYKPGILEELKQKYNGREIVCYQITEPVYQSLPPEAMTGISKNTKYPELAMKMLELVNTDEKLYNLICFGIEGKHYNLDKNGRVVYNENGDYLPKACWKFGNQFNALLLPGQPDTVWEDTKALNDSAVRSPLAGFMVDESVIRNELSALSTVSSEFGAFGKGASDPEPLYEAYLKKAKEAGLDRVIEEVNKQYKNWVKDNK